MKKTFVLSDESVNRYAFRVLTAGIDLTGFMKNPVMFYNHNTGYDEKPIGRWENLRVEGSKLLADAVFDENDEKAMEVASKVESGFLKGASIGFLVRETSEDPMLMLPGQRRPTVTKCSIYEASITGTPANQNSLQLKFEGGITLSAGFDEAYLNKLLPTVTTEEDMKQLFVKLGLAATATEQEALAAVDALLTKQADVAAKVEVSDTIVKAVLSIGTTNGLVTEANKANWEKLAKADIEAVTEVLGVKPEAGAGAKPFDMNELIEKVKLSLGGEGGKKDDKDDKKPVEGQASVVNLMLDIKKRTQGN